jgi:hypothetical protein
MWPFLVALLLLVGVGAVTVIQSRTSGRVMSGGR